MRILLSVYSEHLNEHFFFFPIFTLSVQIAPVLYKSKEKLEAQLEGTELSDDERNELKRLRRVTYRERDSKKGISLLRLRNEVKFNFIKTEPTRYPVIHLCQAMRVLGFKIKCTGGWM
ncbi:hypothetical protein ACT0HV_000560 [Vibrio diabolicus]